MAFGTFHVVLTEDLEIALDLSPAAQAYRTQAATTVMGRGAAEHPEELHLRAGNRRAITVAVIAQIWSMDSTLAQTGLLLPIHNCVPRLSMLARTCCEDSMVCLHCFGLLHWHLALDLQS